MKKLIRMEKLVPALLMLFAIVTYSLAQETQGFRQYLMLNPGDSASVTFYDGTTATIKLLDVIYEKDRVRRAIRKAKLRLSVNGEEKWIVAGNYHISETFANVKIDCPVTREYETNGFFPEGAWRLTKDVKLRVWPVNEPLCPEGFFTYPINQKWFATNTTHVLEPVEIDHDNLKPHANDDIYYHCGEEIAKLGNRCNLGSIFSVSE